MWVKEGVKKSKGRKTGNNQADKKPFIKSKEQKPEKREKKDIKYH